MYNQLKFAIPFIVRMGVIFILTFLAISTVKAQYNSAPLPVEAFLGNNRFAFSTVVNKQFGPASRFGFFTVLAYAAGYKNDLSNQDFIANANVNYKLLKNFSAVLGLSINATNGFHGTGGFQYQYQTKEMLVVLSPVIDFSKSYNLETIALVEYKPQITTTLRLYTKAQGFYSHDTKNDLHARSYVNLRLGLTSTMFTYGLAVNEDYYGPAKLLKENYGVFVRALFP